MAKKTREQELWGIAAEHAATLEKDPENELARAGFWKAIELMFSLREDQQVLEPKLSKPCLRDQHEGFRCILARGHPPPCVYEVWSVS